MEVESYAHGEPSWQDVSADAAKAADFYSALFGWEIPEGTEEYGGYRNASLQGRKVAGISPQNEPGPPVWSTYINVDNADAVAELVAANGGQVMVPPMEVAPYGTMAIFIDPTGAVFGAWQPAEHRGAEIRNVPGAVTWYELVTTDVDAAANFYSAVFGWVAQAHGGAAAPGGYTEFKLGEKTVGGMMAKPPMIPAEVPSFWAVYFAVDDTDAAVAKITELGGKVVMGPTDIQPGRFAVV
ncbi:MAG: VOC family protein, partial [Actinomycetota bacterium]